jgi:hypothetical protein
MMREATVIPFSVAREPRSGSGADRYLNLALRLALIAVLAGAGALLHVAVDLIEPVSQWAVRFLPKLGPAWDAALSLIG